MVDDELTLDFRPDGKIAIERWLPVKNSIEHECYVIAYYDFDKIITTIIEGGLSIDESLAIADRLEAAANQIRQSCDNEPRVSVSKASLMNILSQIA